MRDFSKALANIRKAMRDQDSEFRREEGLAPRESKPAPKIPSLKPEPKPSQKTSAGNLSPDRFLNTSISSAPAPETHTQPHAPEIVEVIPQKDSRHSWLYNEVAKAVQNASDGNPNTKVVAVFVPVVQSGHEFEELPVTHSVELPPVHEADFSVEDDIDIQQDPVPAEAVADEQKPCVLNESKPVRLKKDDLPAPEPEQPEDLPAPEQESPAQEEPAPADSEPQESAEPDLPEELSAEAEQAEHLGELIPESMEHPDPELAEAFTTMEEKLDESISAENELPESENAATDEEDFSDGEKMSFTEITPADDEGSLPDLVFPDELEDDEIIDDIDESSEDSKAN